MKFSLSEMFRTFNLVWGEFGGTNTVRYLLNILSPYENLNVYDNTYSKVESWVRMNLIELKNLESIITQYRTLELFVNKETIDDNNSVVDSFTGQRNSTNTIQNSKRNSGGVSKNENKTNTSELTQTNQNSNKESDDNSINFVESDFNKWNKLIKTDEKNVNNGNLTIQGSENIVNTLAQNVSGSNELRLNDSSSKNSKIVNNRVKVNQNHLENLKDLVKIKTSEIFSSLIILMERSLRKVY